MAKDCIGTSAEEAVNGLQNGELCLLENVRFHAGEEKNDAAFAKALAAPFDMCDAHALPVPPPPAPDIVTLLIPFARDAGPIRARWGR